MTRREHPRRRGFYVMGGGPIPGPEDATLEDFLSGPPAGGPLESPATGNLPAEGEEDPVAAAIAWDQATAAEPYQVDITRTLEDTTRMGNSLSAAVRLELLSQSMREEFRDRRPGPGFPPDFDADQLDAAGYDPVDGAELDPVDGLPIPAEDEDQADDVASDQLDDVVTELAAWRTLADLEAEAAPLTCAAPPPPRAMTEEEELAEALRPTPMEAVMAMVMTAERAATTGGVPARVLNWTSRHDVKSLEYGVRARLRAPAPLVDRAWDHGPILDQGTAPPLSLHDASGCTGHAGVNAANILTLAARPGPADLLPPLDHADAMRLYERAQELDEVPGEAYPGTSILAVMKAGQEVGLWGSYLWAFGTRDVAQAILQVGPVVVGIPWLSKMADPGPDGIVTVAGDDQGGHALCLFALRMKVAGRAGPFFGALQTWGPDVGDHGVIWVHHRDLARLLHGRGEAAIPIPDTLP